MTNAVSQRSDLAERAALVDDIVLSAWRELLAPAWPRGLALLAVGGYGREELFPESDIDLLLLFEKTPADKESRGLLQDFFGALWDRGLRLSHSSRTVSECCAVHEENIELNISLLDRRMLTGDAALSELLEQRLPRFLASERQRLIRHLLRLARERHAKFQETVYHLEPNVKEAPGGLRDLHLIGWLEKLRDPSKDSPGWTDKLAAPRRFVSELRSWLHRQAGRDQNLLQFELQEQYAASTHGSADAAPALMREYYLNARQVHRAARQAMELSDPGGTLFGQFRDWRARLSNSEFTVSRERIYLRLPGLLDTDPETSLRLMRFVARHGILLAPETERRLEASLPAIAGHFSAPSSVWYHLREVLSLPYAVMALRAMHETGLLRALLPEWGRGEGLVLRDFYHRYTVDEHSLIAIEALFDLEHVQDVERKRFAEVFGEIDDRPVLLFTLLLHDAGKCAVQADHAGESLRLAADAMARIGMPAEQQQVVRFLVERHLELSGIMNTRDLGEPSTARLIAERAETVELLKYLAVLTYADICAVNPSAMTPWRLSQLWQTYLLGYRELTRELDTDRIIVPAEGAEFLNGFPRRYTLTHTPEEIKDHLAMAARSRSAGVAVDLCRRDGVYRLTVVTRDRFRLFASIAGALSSFGMNILKAEAFANRNSDILDTFVFEDPGRTLELNPPEVERLIRTIERVSLGREDVRHLLRGRPRRSPPGHSAGIRPVVRFDQEASAGATLAEIVAEDRPGLLYDLARTFSDAGLSIDVVLIDTEAHKAIDVFYVTREGAKLPADMLPELERQLLDVCAA